MYFVLLYLTNLKILVKILNGNTLISVGSCFLFCMLAICVFSASSSVCVRNSVDILRRPRYSCYVVPLSWCAHHNIPLLITLLSQLSSIQNLISRFCDFFFPYRNSLVSKNNFGKCSICTFEISSLLDTRILLRKLLVSHLV